MIGAAKRWKVAAEEMGLPGRPKIGMDAGPEGSSLRGRLMYGFKPEPATSPKTRGLPGWMRTPVK